MAIYHCTVKIINRSSGRSSVGAAAYRAGERIVNESDSVIHNYENKEGVEHKEIILPENAPREYSDRALLWNAVELVEKRKDAQTAREVEVALPVEFTAAERREVLREYAADNFVSKGMIADICVHDKQDGNPHAHIMLTTRAVDIQGFGKKDRSWNDRDKIHEWRESWASVCNARLARHGEKIDHRTLSAQGIERVPQIHVGATATAMAKKEVWPDKEKVARFRDNRFILDHNRGRFDGEVLVHMMNGHNEYNSRYVWQTEDAVQRLERCRAVEPPGDLRPAEEKTQEPGIPAARPVMNEEIPVKQTERPRPASGDNAAAYNKLKNELDALRTDCDRIYGMEDHLKDLQERIKAAGWGERHLKRALKYNYTKTQNELKTAKESFTGKYGLDISQADGRVKAMEQRLAKLKPPEKLPRERKSVKEIMRNAKEQADQHNAIVRERGIKPPTRSGPLR